MPYRVRVFILSSLVLAGLITSGCGLLTEDERYIVEAYDGPAFGQEDTRTAFSAEVQSSRVVLRSIAPDTPDNPHDNDIMVVTLKQQGDRLPVLEDVWYGPKGGGVGEEIKRARVQIQNWDTSGIISGVLRTTLPAGMKTAEMFWIKMPD